MNKIGWSASHRIYSPLPRRNNRQAGKAAFVQMASPLLRAKSDRSTLTGPGNGEHP